MEENREKQLDAFIKKMVAEVGLETPSTDFTASVISKLGSETERPHIFVYKPLISKQVWVGLAILVVGIFSYAFFGNAGSDIDWLPTLELNSVPEFNVLNWFSNFPISNTAVYGFLGLAFFIWIQVFILKRRFDKQFAID